MSQVQGDDLNESQNPTEKSGVNGGKSGDDPTKIHIETNPVEIISGTAGFVKSILSLRNIQYDYDKVIASVKEGIVFKGYNVWILMFSILIASIGLNVDSTAVIIGAMLISPLMGPIKGIGFGVATNDFKLLLESLKNFGITVGISLAVAYLYFIITPVHDLTSNIFARTEPNFLDVLIALFGGLAGVVAHTQGKNDTVIPGVAIATALMPPLCTASYGLSIGNWAFFAGASYLFILNSLMIAASTFFFVRYLKFPKKEYLTPKIESRVRVYTLIFMIVAVAPSGYLFYKMTKRSIFVSNASAFVHEVVENADENIVVTPTYLFDWDNSTIKLAISNFHADKTTLEMWNRLKNTEAYGLDYAKLKIQQDADIESLMDAKLEDYSAQNSGANTLAQILSQKENQITLLQNNFDQLQSEIEFRKNRLKFDHLLAGFKIDYPEYKHVLVNESYSLNEKNSVDTTYLLSVQFKDQVNAEKRDLLNSKISRRLKLELLQSAGIVQDSIRVIVME